MSKIDRVFMVIASLVFSLAGVAWIQASELECTPIVGFAETWFRDAEAQMAESDTLLLSSDDRWESASNDFADSVLNYVNDCADRVKDYRFYKQFHVHVDKPYRDYNAYVQINPIDVNLDDDQEWLVKFYVGDMWQGQGYLYLIYQLDERWTIQPLRIPEHADISPDEVFPTGAHVFPQTDVKGYTYMGVSLTPSTDPHIGGLMVLRWKDWAAEDVLLIPQVCADQWAISSEGILYISTASSIPQQGCTVNPTLPESGIMIPNAIMRR